MCILLQRASELILKSEGHVHAVLQRANPVGDFIMLHSQLCSVTDPYQPGCMVQFNFFHVA